TPGSGEGDLKTETGGRPSYPPVVLNGAGAGCGGPAIPYNVLSGLRPSSSAPTSDRIAELANCENPSALARAMERAACPVAVISMAWCSGKYGARPKPRMISTGASAEHAATCRCGSPEAMPRST